MRTTVEIPDETYRSIKVLAAEQGSTVRELVLEGLEYVRRKGHLAPQRFEIPVIRSSKPGSLHIDNETIYDLIDLP